MTPMQRQLAEALYRRAWEEYREELDEEQRRFLENVMDTIQVHIAEGPNDPLWVAFISTLPGFVEYWQSFPDLLMANMREDRG